MNKIQFDKYLTRPKTWDGVLYQIQTLSKEEPTILELTGDLPEELKPLCDQYQVPVTYWDGVFVYDPIKKSTIVNKGPLLPAVIQFFYQKAVAEKRELCLIHANGSVERYYFGSQEEHDISDFGYPYTGDENFKDRSGIKFAIMAKDIICVILKAEENILNNEWTNFQLMEHLEMAKIKRIPYRIIGHRF